ncbi:VOC family protein [Evansella halocellulosilytica]|uniref:VOC family protein n=1 Tax=Evansella halocellulosilytica TaxID=2011013 RepID=UPI0015C85035|nr:VOC family protein [Evansella halocellulosilytica]
MSEVKTKQLVKKVHCNYIPVSNAEEAVKWYERCLNIKRLNPNEMTMELGNGDWLFLIEAKHKTNTNFVTDKWRGDDYEMYSLTFETTDIQAFYEHLVEQNVEVTPINDGGPCGLQLTFKDLDGNKFHVWEDTHEWEKE